RRAVAPGEKEGAGGGGPAPGTAPGFAGGEIYGRRSAGFPPEAGGQGVGGARPWGHPHRSPEGRVGVQEPVENVVLTRVTSRGQHKPSGQFLVRISSFIQAD